MEKTQITISEADTILSRRGFAAWSDLADNEKSGFVARAIDYVSFTYGPFIADVDPNDDRIHLACILLANEFSTNAPDFASSGQIKSTKLKSGDKELSTDYQDADKTQEALERYPLIAAILAPLRIIQSASVPSMFLWRATL